MFHLIVGNQSGVHAKAKDGFADVTWCCSGSEAGVSGSFGLHFCCLTSDLCLGHRRLPVLSHRLHGMMAKQWEEPSHHFKAIKKQRCSCCLGQSPMKIKELPCCTFRREHPALIFPPRFIRTSPLHVLFCIFSMLDYEASFISFHLFLTFRNGEEHPSKFSHRPIFKLFFFLPAEVGLSTSFPKAFSIHGAQQS